MLPSRHRLRRSAELKRVRQEGRRWHHPLITLLVYTHPSSENSPSPSRFAFVAGRRVGGAVQRNRVKRRLREVVRHQLPDLLPDRDCVVIARPDAAVATYQELEAGLDVLFTRAGICRTSES
ncbi:MAG: ribonuclease P protein component [Chloroflexota bacterium]